jgi:FAD/FMN-containing dehydrogenase
MGNADSEDVDAFIQHAKAALDAAVYAQVLALRGSVSAEHGVGQQKTVLMHAYQDTHTHSHTQHDGSTSSSADTYTGTDVGVHAGASAGARTAAEIAMMRGIKALMDPRGILNPGKVLPL